MSVVKPSNPRSRVEETESGVRISIPARRSIPTLLFPLMVVIGGMLMLDSGLDMVRIAQKYGSAGVADIVFVLMFVGFIIYGVVMLLWTLVGIEVLVVSPLSLSHGRKLLGLGPTRQYDAAHVSNLRLLPTSPAAAQAPLGGGQAALGFDYGSKTVRLGAGLDEPEAAMLLEQVSRRLG